MSSDTTASRPFATEHIDARFTSHSSPLPSPTHVTTAFPSLDASISLHPLSIDDVKAFLTVLSPILAPHSGAIHAYGVRSVDDVQAFLRLFEPAIVRVVEELEKEGLPRLCGRVLLQVVLAFQRAFGMDEPS